MFKTFQCQIDVRGYELDSFGHVNHGVYASYLEHARWKLLEGEGIHRSTFEQWKISPVVMRLEINYLKPAYIGDVLEIRSTHLEHTHASLTFEQVIYRLESPSGHAVHQNLVQARVKVVTVNEQGRPTRMPVSMSRAWQVISP